MMLSYVFKKRVFYAFSAFLTQNYSIELTDFLISH
ncbi:hypothetical protein SAMN06298214_0807 [Bacteroidales bacterium WCE2004]|nr:hypothetical protein SAMN06298214_0807 [Bacteroidales bacterium WCE2004]